MVTPPPEKSGVFRLHHSPETGIKIEASWRSDLVATFPSVKYPMEALLEWCLDRHVILEQIVFARDTGAWEFTVRPCASKRDTSRN